MHEFLASQTFGVIIGSALSFGTMWFYEARRDKKKLKYKKAEIYERTLQNLTSIIAKTDYTKRKFISDQDKEKILYSIVPITIYGSEKARNLVKILNEEVLSINLDNDKIFNLLNEFVGVIRKELGIK